MDEMAKTILLGNTITEAELNKIKKGDVITINDWKEWYIVKGVSKNFIVAVGTGGDLGYYTIISKKPWEYGNHNSIEQGKFWCGPDSWLFGFPGTEAEGFYSFENPENVEKYLDSLERGETTISIRHGDSIRQFFVQRFL